MYRIHRYLFRECAFTSLIALLVLSFMAMLPQFLRLVDLWVNRDMPVSVLGTMISLSMPKILLTTIPMALLVGILLTLGRLAQESELVVLKACGISPLQILQPVALLALLYTMLALALSTLWLPRAYHHFASLKQALLSSTTLALKPQAFSHNIPGLTLYIEEQDPQTQLLYGLLIHDRRKAETPITLTARRGEIRSLPSGETILYLQEGTRHQSLPEQHYRALRFATYQMDLGIALGSKSKASQKQLDELSQEELSQIMREASPKESYAAWMEWHRRFSFPTATLILGLFAVPLGLQQSPRSGRSYALVVAVLTLIIHFALLSVGETLARKQIITPILGFWMPNLLMASLTLYVITITHQCRPFLWANWLGNSLANLPQRLLAAPQDK
ncbi:LPS export ABC transporter permease LptF [Candidatus Magnetaquicoccus inordinatus]|uniref:LPS export ABC transporter permease LptF n=1 Tax=Candidatus Magnetaquicoccus inordinatus TaxID=2496818 RepID=UPI00187D3F14|nr:LPS export ABC transporter permease LptF [Candidatus Magnetaquicoccus inordinatus]